MTDNELEQMVQNYGDQMLRTAFLYLQDRQLAEDAVQEAFIKIYRGYDKFRGESAEKTWVIRILINVCKSMLRQNRQISVPEALLESIPAPEEMPLEDSILAEVMRLKPAQREVILLYYYHALTTKEIAGILRLPQATVLTRMRRARQVLKERLEGEYFDG